MMGDLSEFQLFAHHVSVVRDRYPEVPRIRAEREAIYKQEGRSSAIADEVVVLLGYVEAQRVAMLRGEPVASLSTVLSKALEDPDCPYPPELASRLLTKLQSFTPPSAKRGLFHKESPFERLYHAWEAASPEDRQRVLALGASSAPAPALTGMELLEHEAWNLASDVHAEAFGSR